MLVRCLYASRPIEPLSGPFLDSILQQSRKNNPALGITGLLCVSKDLFIQVIEGGRDEVCDLFNAIVAARASFESASTELAESGGAEGKPESAGHWRMHLYIRRLYQRCNAQADRTLIHSPAVAGSAGRFRGGIKWL